MSLAPSHSLQSFGSSLPAPRLTRSIPPLLSSPSKSETIKNMIEGTRVSLALAQLANPLSYSLFRLHP